jgi:hypothetical protein
MAKLNLAKVMTAVRSRLFPRSCSSKEERPPVQRKVEISKFFRIAIICYNIYMKETMAYTNDRFTLRFYWRY